MLSIKHLFRGTTIYGIGQLLNRGISIFLLPVYTKYLLPEQFGVYSLLVVVSGLLTCIFSLGVGVTSGLIYFEEDNALHKATTIWSAIITLGCSAVLLMLIGFFSASALSEILFQSSRLHNLLLLSFCHAALLILIQPPVLALQYMGEAVLSVSLSVFSVILIVGLNIYFVMIARAGVTGIMAGTVLGNGISLCLYLTILLKKQPPHFSLATGKRLLKLIKKKILIFVKP